MPGMIDGFLQCFISSLNKYKTCMDTDVILPENTYYKCIFSHFNSAHYPRIQLDIGTILLIIFKDNHGRYRGTVCVAGLHLPAYSLAVIISISICDLDIVMNLPVKDNGKYICFHCYNIRYHMSKRQR